MENLHIGTWRNSNVRIYAIDSKEIVQNIVRPHHTTPLASAALGRVVSVAAMMGAMLKGDSKITIKIDGGGPLGSILVDASSSGGVRGFIAHPSVDLPLKNNGKINVGLGVGTNGFLSVTKSLDLKQNYATQVALQSGEIGDDFSFYFLKSEQIPSVVAAGVLVAPDHSIAQAGGWIIQLMPGATEDDFQAVEAIVKVMPNPTVLLSKYQLVDGLNELFKGISWLEKREVSTFCNCSKERFISGIATLNINEIDDMILSGGCDIRCDFCGTNYHLDDQDLLSSKEIKKGK